MRLTPGLYKVELMWGNFHEKTYYSYCDGDTWAHRSDVPQEAWDRRHENKQDIDSKSFPTRAIKRLEIDEFGQKRKAEMKPQTGMHKLTNGRCAYYDGEKWLCTKYSAAAAWEAANKGINTWYKQEELHSAYFIGAVQTPPCPGVYGITYGVKNRTTSNSYWDGHQWHAVGADFWAWQHRHEITRCVNIVWNGKPRLPFPYEDEIKASVAAPIPALAPKATPSDRRRRRLLLN